MVLIGALAQVLVLLLCPSLVGGVEFTRVVDSSTFIPGTELPFFLDAIEPKSCALGTVFVGHVEPGVGSGIYASTGDAITRLVDEDTLLPGGLGNLSDIDEPSCNGVRVAFSATEVVNGQRGVFDWEPPGHLRVIADIATVLPGTSHPVVGLGSPSVAVGKTTFRGLEAIVTTESLFIETGGELSEFVDSSDVPPGQSQSFSSLSASDLGFEAVFRGIFPDLTSGIYARSSTGLRVVADYSTPVFQKPNAFLRQFGVPRVSGGLVAFSASTTESGSGVFVVHGDVAYEEVAYLTQLPSGGQLTRVGKVDIDRNVIAFVGFAGSETRARLLLWRDQNLEEVLTTGANFDGGIVEAFTYSLENEHLTVWMLFRDSTAAIYSASLERGPHEVEVPTLSAWASVLLIFLLTAVATLHIQNAQHHRSR